jgi:hypothetical protein
VSPKAVCLCCSPYATLIGCLTVLRGLCPEPCSLL